MADRNIIDTESQQHTKLKPIESQTIANKQSLIQEEVTQLESVITKTIENNNENVKEVERELEKIANERKAATEKVILTDSFNTKDDFIPIVETFSEDDTIVIKPKTNTNGDGHANESIYEDNAIKSGKMAAIDINTDNEKIASTIAIVPTTFSNKDKFNKTNKLSETFDVSNELDDNRSSDDVTISSDSSKVRISYFIKRNHIFILRLYFLSQFYYRRVYLNYMYLDLLLFHLFILKHLCTSLSK